MSRSAAFEAEHRRYEDWFAAHPAVYQSELLALRALLPWEGAGLEIGVGSGRFAGPLGIDFGVDPSPAMLSYAARRGVRGVVGTAEALPFRTGTFNIALVVTTICFVDSPERMLLEAARVLRPGGELVIGFVDRDSILGEEYLAHQAENVFYRDARFYSTAEVEDLLSAAEFGERSWLQTVFRPLSHVREIEPLRPGTGRGGFVAVRATCP